MHRLAPGGPLRLGGVDIPFDRHLHGHSDGDVVLHALADALLGAVAAGDIGTHFPDTEERYRGIDSADLLQRVVTMLREAKCAIGNVDVTILAEQPKLAPRVSEIRARVAAILGIDVNRVAVKAKTMEGIGVIGSGEAIAALAVAAVDGG